MVSVRFVESDKYEFAGSAYWAEPSPLFAHRARPSLFKCENEYLLLALGEVTAAQAVVGSIVWAFRRLIKPRIREMSARGYALHSVCPQLSFFPSLISLLATDSSSLPSDRHFHRFIG